MEAGLDDNQDENTANAGGSSKAQAISCQPPAPEKTGKVRRDLNLNLGIKGRQSQYEYDGVYECAPNQRTPDPSDGASHYRHLRRYVVKSLRSSMATVWRPMPPRRWCYGGH